MKSSEKKKIQGGRFQFKSRKHFPKDRVAQPWHYWEVVGIFKQKRTPEGAESRRAHIPAPFRNLF